MCEHLIDLVIGVLKLIIYTKAVGNRLSRHLSNQRIWANDEDNSYRSHSLWHVMH